MWFSDFYAQRVLSIAEDGSGLRTEVELDDQPSGLGWMPDGSLLIVAMRSRTVRRRWPDGQLERHADLAEVADFLCNDMVVDPLGRAWVGNFGFDFDAAVAEKGFQILADHPTTRLARVDPDGFVSVAAEDMSFPNGTVITPDGKTLIIAETLRARLTAFDIAADGTLAARRVWAETWPRIPDGICLDAEGAVWAANPLAPECVRFAEGGEVLETIDTGMNCIACMLGGEARRTLFMLTAPSAHAATARVAPKAKLVACEVDVGRAGWP